MSTRNGVGCCSTNEPQCARIHGPSQTIITKPWNVRLFRYCYALPYMAPQPDAPERLAQNRPQNGSLRRSEQKSRAPLIEQQKVFKRHTSIYTSMLQLVEFFLDARPKDDSVDRTLVLERGRRTFANSHVISGICLFAVSCLICLLAVRCFIGGVDRTVFRSRLLASSGRVGKRLSE